MYLSLTTAKEFVRSRIDELSQVESDMLIDNVDDRNLDFTVEKNLPEAITYVHLYAIPTKLEGKSLDESAFEDMSVSDGVIDINFKDKSIGVLRLVSFLSGDSSVVVTEAIDEDSPLGRMQLNKHIRGREDDPVLVLQHDSVDYQPHYRYYTTGEDEPTFKLIYFPVPSLETDGYYVSSKLYEATLNYLTGMVMVNYSQPSVAEYFFTKANEYMR